MATIQVKNVPDEVHAVLRRRAVHAGQSLQEYLLAQLVRSASSPTLDEMLDRISGNTGGSLSFREAVRSIRADRDRR